MLSLLSWYAVLLVLGLATYPIAFVMLKHFPDKGYVFSKVLALLLVGYFSWLLGYVSFSGATIFFSFLLVAALSATLLLTWIGQPFKEFFTKNLGFFLLMEGFFLMALLVAGAYKMRTYEIAGTEKPMDFAMINGILASPHMPPQDPWLSGASISYYYFGYFIVAMLCKITSVPSGEGYNMAVALIWALATLCAFSIAYALTRRYRYSFLSAACLTLFGNLDYWHRAIQSFQIGDLRIPYYNFPPNGGVENGLSGFFGFLFNPLQHNWDYFQASRIVPVPPTDKLINEFPSFSFFLSDLHPHVMAIPFVLLSVAVAFNFLKAPLPGLALFGGQRPWQWLQWGLTALVFGALSFMNSWDFPTFMLLLGICLFLQQWWSNEKSFNVWARSVVLVGVPIVIGAFLLYLPFYVRFQSQAKGIGIVKDRTDLYYLAVIFGLFFILEIPAAVGRALGAKGEKTQRPKTKKAEELECVVCGREESGKKFCGYCGGELAPSAKSEVSPLPDEPTQQFLAKVAAFFTGPSGSNRGWISLGVAVAVLLLLNIPQVQLGDHITPIKLATLALAALMAVFTVVSLGTPSESRESVFTTLMLLIGFLLICGCETIFLKDHFSDSALYRMNTVFKFHYQVWILFSLAAGPLLKWLLENQWPRWVAWKRALWLGAAIFALIGAAAYPILAFTARMRGSSPELATMDGETYYEHTFPADFQAAQWIKQNIKPIQGKTPVILEAWGGSYQQQYDTLATMTGFPTVLGWDFHEAQWRGSWDQAAVRGQNPGDTVFQRRSDVDAIYTSSDLNQTRDLLKKYGVDYVYVGDAEREKYKDHLENLGKFGQLGTIVQAFGSSVLYKINPLN